MATGLYNFRNRDYSPALGHWMQVDPLGLSPDSNAFRAYANSPTNFRDPSGLSSEGALHSGIAVSPTSGMGPSASISGIYESGPQHPQGGLSAFSAASADRTFDPLSFGKGLGVGLADGGMGFFEGLGKLAWSFFWHPIETSTGIYYGIKGLIQEIIAGDLADVAKELFPELYDLAHNWDRNTDEYNGYLIGKMVGNYGASILTPMGAAKILQMLKAAKAAKLASKVAPIRGNPFRVCFPAGTMIATPEGQRPIDEIREGDQVFAWDSQDRQLAVRKVLVTFTHFTKELVQITLDDGSRLESTVAHPFWVTGMGWKIAADLREGMRLFGINSQERSVHAVARRETLSTVYNFEVERDHNYFAGHTPVLVHNQKTIDTDFNNATKVALEWLKSQGVDTSKPVGPVLGRPFPGSPHAGKPVGVRFAGGGYYRIEFDPRSGAHINVGIGKTTGPHIRFEGGQKTVDNLISRLFRC
jgi:hypothetical protein